MTTSIANYGLVLEMTQKMMRMINLEILMMRKRRKEEKTEVMIRIILPNMKTMRMRRMEETPTTPTITEVLNQKPSLVRVTLKIVLEVTPAQLSLVRVTLKKIEMTQIVFNITLKALVLLKMGFLEHLKTNRYPPHFPSLVDHHLLDIQTVKI